MVVLRLFHENKIFSHNFLGKKFEVFEKKSLQVAG